MEFKEYNKLMQIYFSERESVLERIGEFEEAKRRLEKYLENVDDKNQRIDILTCVGWDCTAQNIENTENAIKELLDELYLELNVVDLNINYLSEKWIYG